MFTVFTSFKIKILLFVIVHSRSSNIPENIKKNLIFCITNLIKTVVVDIISNNNSFTRLLPEAEPLIATQKTIPKSINKLTGIVNTKKANKSNEPNAQTNILLCINNNVIDVKIKRLIVKINRTAKKK